MVSWNTVAAGLEHDGVSEASDKKDAARSLKAERELVLVTTHDW